jgi:hypothetical protein
MSSQSGRFLEDEMASSVKKSRWISPSVMLSFNGHETFISSARSNTFATVLREQAQLVAILR